MAAHDTVTLTPADVEQLAYGAFVASRTSGFSQLVPAARANGIAVLAVTRSYNCGVVGHHVEALARDGLVALACEHAGGDCAVGR